MSDVSNGDSESSVMVALLPTTTNWCKIDLPHMTLVYAGLIKDLKVTDYNELAKEVTVIAMNTSPITLRVIGIEVFGDTDKVDVLKFRLTPALMAMRKAVESWNASKFPFSPHATIGPVGTVVKNPPKYITFDRIMVGWGNEKVVFPLKGGVEKRRLVKSGV